MAFGKKNHVKTDLTKYNVCLLGESKVGKTTLAYHVAKTITGEDGYMFLECGNERGADAIEGINHVNCPEWWREYDEDNNSIGLGDVIEDIIENKTEEYPNLKLILIDTYDQIINIAEEETIRLWNKENPDKRTNSINAAWGGYGRGEKKAIELIFNKIDELHDVGVGVWILGHTKNKDVTDIVSGETYQTVTSDQQQNYFNALKKTLHFLGLAYIDRAIVKEKTGKKDFKNKEIVINKVSSESRKIKFRDDNYAVDSGSRFAEITPEIDLEPSQFIEALTNAIMAEQKKSGKSFEQSKKEEQKSKEIQEKKIAEREKQKKVSNKVNDLRDEIITFIKENIKEVGKMAAIMNKVKELGYSNPTEIDDVEKANAIIAFIATL